MDEGTSWLELNFSKVEPLSATVAFRRQLNALLNAYDMVGGRSIGQNFKLSPYDASINSHPFPLAIFPLIVVKHSTYNKYDIGLQTIAASWRIGSE